MTWLKQKSPKIWHLEGKCNPSCVTQNFVTDYLAVTD